MTVQNFENKMKDYKKGTYIAMEWQSVNGEYTKVSKGVVRVLNPQVQVSKANVEYIRLKTTNNPKQKVHTKYFKNGVEISKQEYEMVNQPSNVRDWFTKHLCDIISIG